MKYYWMPVIALASLILGGCSTRPTTIILAPSTSYKTNALFPQRQLALGRFTAQSQFAQDHLNSLTERLQQLLQKKQNLQPQSITQPPVLIGGKLAIEQGSFTYQNRSNQIKMQVTFQFTDPATHKILHNVQSTLFTRNPSGIKNQLIRAVDSMVDSLFPNQKTVQITLPRGYTRFDADGRKLAATGDYARAASAFKMAIDARPDDHNAMFNCGVMYELLHDPTTALDYYRRANQVSPQMQYIDAIRRLQHE